MPYSASHLWLLIQSNLGIWGKCKEKKCKEENIKSEKKDKGCEKGGSELLKKRWSKKTEDEICQSGKFLGCQGSSYHCSECVWGRKVWGSRWNGKLLFQRTSVFSGLSLMCELRVGEQVQKTYF